MLISPRNHLTTWANVVVLPGNRQNGFLLVSSEQYHIYTEAKCQLVIHSYRENVQLEYIGRNQGFTPFTLLEEKLRLQSHRTLLPEPCMHILPCLCDLVWILMCTTSYVKWLIGWFQVTDSDLERIGGNFQKEISSENPFHNFFPWIRTFGNCFYDFLSPSWRSVIFLD